MAKPSSQKQSSPATAIKKFIIPTWWFFAFLGLVCLVFFWNVIFGLSFFWEDLIEYDYPVRIFARDAILLGQFPHWNPFTFSGMPFFAALQTATLYPSNLLLSILPVSNGTFWYLIEMMIVLHALIAGVTMFFFGWEFSLSRTAALFAGVGYMLCGFFVCHLIHSMILFIGAWIPLVMLMLKRGAETGRIKWFAGAGLILGATIFAGSPQVTFYEFMFLGCFAIYLIFEHKKSWIKIALFSAVSFTIAGCLSFIQLLPSVEISSESVRSLLTFEAASEGSIGFRHWLTFLIPKLYGGISVNKELPFWLNDAYHSGYWTFWETTFYTGIPILLLGAIGFYRIKSNKLLIFAAAWAAFSFFIALGSNTPIFSLLFNYVPGFDKFRIPSRILFTWNVLLPILAAFMIDEWMNHDRFKKLFKPLLIGCGVLALFGFIVASGMAGSFWIDFTEENRLQFAQKQGGILLGIVLALASIFFMYYQKKIDYRMFKGLLLIMVVVDLFLFGFNYHTVNYSAPQVFERNKQAADFFKRESRKEILRIKMREGGAMFLGRNQGMIDKVQLLEGYTQLNLLRKQPLTTPQRQLDLLNVKYAIAVDYEKKAMGLNQNPAPLPRAWMCFRHTICKDDSTLKQVLSADSFDYRHIAIIEKPLKTPLPEDTQIINNAVRIKSYKNNAIDLAVSTDKNGLLILSEIWYPAWQVYVDGKKAEMYRVDYSLRGVEVPAGSHTVSFKFQSKLFSIGLILTLIALFIGMALIAGDVLMSRKNQPKVV